MSRSSSSGVRAPNDVDSGFSDVNANNVFWELPEGDSLSSFLGRLGVDSTGLLAGTSLIIPQRLSIEEWEELGDRLFACWESMSWWIGDWLVYGQDNYPDRYKVAVQRTGLSYQTLRNYACVARKFSTDRRRQSLSFQHHAEVSGLPPEEQDRWLERALKFAWSRNELRRRIKAYQLNGAKGESRDIRFQVQASPDMKQRWAMAAKAHNESLDAWIVKVLNQAASAVGEHGPSPVPADGPAAG
ncbi:LmbU family transcriptional regulator [Nocardiopsis sp. CNT-189]|uniref:LmbU family transcriptional regulator n=1 Tax=Nocardiopsis oceanisediminis TaxID=2816862 RepID=UPI003B3BBED9